MTLSFRKKLALPLLLSWLCLLGVLSYNLITVRGNRLEERKAQLMAVTDMALSVAKDYDALQASGKLPADEAKKQALERIKALRYGTSGYFTVLDDQKVLMHPIKAELVGTDVGAFKDPNGTPVYLDALKVTAGGGGFTSYLWAKPGEKDPIAKLAYDGIYKPWGWTFMTGVYMDDLDTAFYSDLKRTIGLLVAIGLTLTVAISLVIRNVQRSIGGEPAHAAETATRISNGDLTVSVPLKDGDTGSLMFAIETMRDKLATIVSDVRTSTDSISTASSEIATGNQDLSSRTEHQAGALQETAAAISQLASTVKQNAANSRQAHDVASSAFDTATKGGGAVAEVVITMGEINASARKISDIIGVINGIAFQTNILALNAAVEAARAGEQGRGFAVVASEVRSLAQRSAGAAKEIESLITESVRRVDVGAKLVDQAGQTMQEVVSSVKRMTALMTDISAATQEQSAGIDQVNQAVSSMDQSTQQNAAMVEEATAAAQSLREQAGALVNLVSVFKVAGPAFA